MIILFSLIKAILIADLISGIGHWLQDRYGKIGAIPFIEKTFVLPNIEHHKTPRSFLERSYWERNDVMIIVAVVFLQIMYFANALTLTNVFAALLLSQINEFHAMSHRKKKDISKFIVTIQRLGLLQSSKHHNLHHSAPFECRYCILTEYLNPILDKLKFFRALEWIIFLILRIRPNSQ